VEQLLAIKRRDLPLLESLTASPAELVKT